MKTEKQSCCLCFNIVSDGNIVDLDILQLLKFLVVNVDTSALKNCTVCDGCLNKIIETCEYKTRNSSKMLMETKKEIHSETSIICQKCKKTCEQGDNFPLLDCVTQIDWSDFVNYLFVDQDSQSLERSQICDFCRISLLNIQNFLKLIYVYDQSKMKCDIDIDNCDDINFNTIGNSNVLENIKQECERCIIVDDKIEIKNTIRDNNTEILHTDFKCKKEVEFKLEYNNQSNYGYEKVDVEKERTGGCINKNPFNDEKEEQGINSQECNNAVHNKVRKSKCLYCSKAFVNKSSLNNHLLRIHKCRDRITSKIHDCDKCSYSTTRKHDFLRHKFRHGKTGLEKNKDQNCNKYNLFKRITHKNRNFKCEYCSKEFVGKINFDDHLLGIHNCRDKITSKVYECNKCSFVTVLRGSLLQHNLTHETIEILKCHQCNYETHNKSLLTKHINEYKNREFKCIFCSKNFTGKLILNRHLLTVHACGDHGSKKISVTTAENKMKQIKDNNSNEIHECDKCNYSTTNNKHLLRHKLYSCTKIEGLEKYKCQNCNYETYSKHNLFRHIQTHNNTREIKKCTLCSRKFTAKRYLDDHLLKVHESKYSVSSKIHECDLCNYSTTKKDHLLIHKLKHGIKDGLKKSKCQYCAYVTYRKYNLNKHLEVHNIHDVKCSKKFIKKINLNYIKVKHKI